MRGDCNKKVKFIQAVLRTRIKLPLETMFQCADIDIGAAESFSVDELLTRHAAR